MSANEVLPGDAEAPSDWTTGYERGWVDAHDALVVAVEDDEQRAALVHDVAAVFDLSYGAPDLSDVVAALWEAGWRRPTDPGDASRDSQSRTEWGVRWPDCPPGDDVEDDAGCRDGGESYARNIARLHADAQLVKRETRTTIGKWEDAT